MSKLAFTVSWISLYSSQCGGQCVALVNGHPMKSDQHIKYHALFKSVTGASILCPLWHWLRLTGCNQCYQTGLSLWRLSYAGDRICTLRAPLFAFGLRHLLSIVLCLFVCRAVYGQAMYHVWSKDGREQTRDKNLRLGREFAFGWRITRLAGYMWQFVGYRKWGLKQTYKGNVRRRKPRKIRNGKKMIWFVLNERQCWFDL